MLGKLYMGELKRTEWLLARGDCRRSLAGKDSCWRQAERDSQERSGWTAGCGLTSQSVVISVQGRSRGGVGFPTVKKGDASASLAERRFDPSHTSNFFNSWTSS